MTLRTKVDDRISILEKIEKRLPNYKKFEGRIVDYLEDDYFSFAYQSFYNEFGYKKTEKLFTTTNFKSFVRTNNFLDFVNDVYNMHLSSDGIKIVDKRLQKVKNFDKYENAISIFKRCNPTKDNKGRPMISDQFSFGTKVLHFYDPEQNPILDNIVKDNLGLKGDKASISKKLSIEFREAANLFVKNHRKYFDDFDKSNIIAQELSKRRMTTNFSTMEILDLALYGTKK